MTDDEQQLIPAGWKPTVAEPLPVTRCTAIKKNGERCKRWSLRGTTVCLSHGGRLPTVQAHAAAVVEAARLRLIGMTDQAVDVLHDLMVNAQNEQVQLNAVKEVLDRAGVKGSVEIDLVVTQGESPAEKARRMLEETASRMVVQSTNHADEDSDTVDGEVITDPQE